MVLLSIVIPLYNEEKVCRSGILDIALSLDSHNIDYELLLVNNGSVDGTREIISLLAKDHSRLVDLHLEKNRGYGGGILFGLSHAQGDYLGFTSCDGEIDGEDLVKTFRQMVSSQADVGKTLRYRRSDGPIRWILSKSYMLLFLLFFGRYIPDVNGYPKIMKRRAYEALRLRHGDWFIDSEILIKAKQKRMRISETRVVYKQRKGGKSHVRLSIVFEFIENLLMTRLFGFNRKK